MCKKNNIYIWNALSVGLFAGSSFVMLMATSWFLGVYWAGVFSIGLAMAQQMFTIGCFCVRRYQASDVDEVYKFNAYLKARFVTCALMLIIGVFWILRGLPNDVAFLNDAKSHVFLWLLLYKASESFSDVLGGRYQQMGRFDISCKIMFFKTLSSLISFCVGIYFIRNLSWALFLSFIVHVLLSVLLDGRMFSRFEMYLQDLRLNSTFLLLLACLPLAIDSFLRMYINNGSKFAIDAIMDKESVAVFSTLFMISFIMAIFSEFILNPHITILAEAYNTNHIDELKKIVKRQVCFILSFGVIGITISYLCGVEILSFIFKINLMPYKMDFCVLFIGGILLALFYLTQLLLIIQRKQLWCLPGVVVSALFVFRFSKFFVTNYGIIGGAIAYAVSMAIMLCFGIVFVFFFLGERMRTKK